MVADRSYDIRVLNKNRNADFELKSNMDALDGQRARKREAMNYERRVTSRSFSESAHHSGYSSAAVVHLDPADLDLPPEEFGQKWAVASSLRRRFRSAAATGREAAAIAIAAAARDDGGTTEPWTDSSDSRWSTAAAPTSPPPPLLPRPPTRPYTAPAGLTAAAARVRAVSAAAAAAAAALGGRGWAKTSPAGAASTASVAAAPFDAGFASGRRQARGVEQQGMALLLGSPNVSRRRTLRPRTVGPAGASTAASAAAAAAALRLGSVAAATRFASPVGLELRPTAGDGGATRPISAAAGGGRAGSRVQTFYREDPVMLKRLVRLSRGLPVNPSGQRPGPLHVAYSSRSCKTALRAMTAVRQKGLDERKHVDFYGDVLERVRAFMDSLQLPPQPSRAAAM